MNRISTIICFLIMGLLLQAQTVGGIVVDGEGLPMEFVNIALLHRSDSLFVAGCVSDKDGRFLLESPAEGLVLRVSYVGYVTQYLTPATGMHITMSDGDMQIDEVVVKGHRPTYKMEGTELVASIQGTILSELGFAPDVLRQLPFVNVSGKEISIVGRGTPVIYINNRKMRGEFELERIPAKMIKDIKIDMQPGARYDATVTAVIHITTILPAGEGLGGQIEGMVKELYAGYGAVRATLHKYVLAR